MTRYRLFSWETRRDHPGCELMPWRIAGYMVCRPNERPPKGWHKRTLRDALTTLRMRGAGDVFVFYNEITGPPRWVRVRLDLLQPYEVVA